MVENKLTDYYGPDVDASEWASMPYLEVLQTKAKLARENILRLQEEPWDEYDINHVARCAAAIRFNERLITEMSEVQEITTETCKDCIFMERRLKCLTCEITEEVIPANGYCPSFEARR